MAILRYCQSSGCAAYAAEGSYYCARHREAYRTAYMEAVDKQRGTASQRGYTSKWTAYSKTFLLHHPVCARCGKPSEVTDHIKPAFAFPELFWDRTNHQPLCRDCNVVKGREDRKLYPGGGRKP